GIYRVAPNSLGLATNGALRFGLGASGELLDGSGHAGDAGQVPTSAGVGAPWKWGEGGGGGRGGSIAYANTSVPAGNTVTDTTAETAFESEYEIPAEQLQAGSVIRIRAAGVYSTDAVAPTLRIRVRLGGDTILDSGAVTATAALTDAGWG